MKKICPYCKRAGEVGESCGGCGYVFQINDASAEAETVSPQPQPVPYQTAQTAQPEPPLNYSSQAPEPARKKPFQLMGFVKKTSVALGYIVAIPLMLFAAVGFFGTLRDYKNNFESGAVSSLVAALFFVIGLLIIHITHLRSLKSLRGKCLIFLLILIFVFLFMLA